jgi:hypothetical protein
MNYYQPSPKVLRTAATASVTLLLLFAAYPSWSQIAEIVERAIGKRITQQAERQVFTGSAEKEVLAAGAVTRTRQGDRLVKHWNQHFCNPKPCPLDKDVSTKFVGNSYDEIVLAKDTILYRRYHPGANEPVGKWYTRSPNAKGTSAIISNAIPISTGNYADKMVKIRVPKGHTIYDGISARQGGLVGGGNQVYLKDVNPSWVIQ